MLARITSKHLTEWKAYAQLEPFGEERADLRSAIVASLIANAFSEENKSFQPEDFMPDFEKGFLRRFMPEHYHQQVSHKIKRTFKTLKRTLGGDG